MDANLTVELTNQQRDLLLEGLRFVRSARKLGFRDPLEGPNAERDNDLRQVTQLMERLHVPSSSKVTATS